MSLLVAWPVTLWALLAVPLFLLTARGARGAALCRSLAATALVLALAGLAVERDRPATGACVVAAIDVSTSVGTAAADAARTFADRLVPALGAGDLVGSLVFASRPRVLAAPAPPSARPLATTPTDADVAAARPGDTDLATALATAAALCPADRQAAVLLFTDGNETRGSVLAEVPPVPVFPIVPAAGALPDVTIRRLLAPAAAPERTFVPVEAVVDARRAVSLAVALEIDGRSATPRPVALRPGVSLVALPYRAEGVATHALKARLLLPAPHTAAPPTARASVVVTRALHARYVTERDAPPVAALALVRRGVDTDLVTPVGFAVRSARLDDVHVVVLDDVGHAALPNRALAALAEWVAAGGALVVTGGAHLFGDAGFVGGPLERLLPVELQSQQPEPEEREPVALYLLIDRSNSMGMPGGTGQDVSKMEYARRAALAVVEQLGPRDLVGAIAFDDTPYELGALRPVAESRAPLGAQIRRLRHGGGTDFLSALDTARRNLLAVGSHVRHVILLTDGDSNRRGPDHYGLIDDLARTDITVTTLRIGTDVVNLDLLATISRATGGDFHHVVRMETLPQLLIRDAQRQLDGRAGRRAGRPRLALGGPMLAGIEERALPPIGQWAVTRPKPDAEVRLVVESGSRRDPLLATWQVGLGRVAVLPVDFQSGGAAWAVWDDFGRLWTQLVQWAAPRALAGETVPPPDPGRGDGGREARAVGPARALLAELATRSGGQVDPEPSSVLSARPGSARETRPLAPLLVPLAMMLVLADVALRRWVR
jgi:secreted protein with Ig-like and vWFA domain